RRNPRQAYREADCPTSAPAFARRPRGFPDRYDPATRIALLIRSSEQPDIQPRSGASGQVSSIRRNDFIVSCANSGIPQLTACNLHGRITLVRKPLPTAVTSYSTKILPGLGTM